jgi:hypothetical protein
LKSANPYRPPSGTEHSVRAKIELPISFPVFATLDILASVALAVVAAITWYGAENRTFVGIFLATEVIAASLLVVSLLATAIGLFLKQPYAWSCFLVSQCIVAFGVLFSYAGLMYVLIDTWGVSHMMWKGGDPNSLAIVTFIFVVVQTFTAIPIVILIRNRPDGRFKHANHGHDV